MTKRQRIEWTRGFIRDFGWRSYLRTCWLDVWTYRLMNWRCWFGHDLGPAQTTYEEYWLIESWRYCERPKCEYCEREE